MITAERLKEVLDYNPDTGIFVWLVTNSNRAPLGSVAGATTKSDYVRIMIDGQRYLGHRLAWLYVTGKWPERHIDHIDTNRRNNRWHNLRLADDSQNGANRKLNRNNSTGFKGVSFMQRRANHARPYLAQIKVGRQHHFLGHFSSAEEAHAAYCRAAKDNFGEFARGE